MIWPMVEVRKALQEGAFGLSLDGRGELSSIGGQGGIMMSKWYKARCLGPWVAK